MHFEIWDLEGCWILIRPTIRHEVFPWTCGVCTGVSREVYVQGCPWVSRGVPKRLRTVSGRVPERLRTVSGRVPERVPEVSRRIPKRLRTGLYGTQGGSEQGYMAPREARREGPIYSRRYPGGYTSSLYPSRYTQVGAPSRPGDEHVRVGVSMSSVCTPEVVTFDTFNILPDLLSGLF